MGGGVPPAPSLDCGAPGHIPRLPAARRSQCSPGSHASVLGHGCPTVTQTLYHPHSKGCPVAFDTDEVALFYPEIDGNVKRLLGKPIQR